jgi:hypothetical protein
MIRDIERQIEAALAVREKPGTPRWRRRSSSGSARTNVGEATANVTLLPPNLVDGMSTVEYLAGISGREAERRRRGRKGVGE